MTPYEMEQAVYNGVRRALIDLVWIGFTAFFIFWAAYQYGGTVLSARNPQSNQSRASPHQGGAFADVMNAHPCECDRWASYQHRRECPDDLRR
jgi:hypothetical protein